MTCPYCGKEMEHGYVKGSQRLFWSKEKEFGIGDEKIRLSQQSFWNGFFNGFSAESYYCPDCKKLITSV